ncbi:UNVERIFIED_CONTAM: hypothetical protein Sindi_0251900 [Sesamum indicum]
MPIRPRPDFGFPENKTRTVSSSGTSPTMTLRRSKHNCVSGIGPRGLILLAHVLIERLPLSGSSVGLCDPGRVLRDPPVTRGADPDREMTLMPLMKGNLVLL